MELECIVKSQIGAYVTNTIRGKRVSCTHSADEAARRLGVKLLGKGLSHVERIEDRDDDRSGVSRWRIVGRPQQ